MFIFQMKKPKLKCLNEKYMFKTKAYGLYE